MSEKDITVDEEKRMLEKNQQDNKLIDVVTSSAEENGKIIPSSLTQVDITSVVKADDDTLDQGKISDDLSQSLASSIINQINSSIDHYLYLNYKSIGKTRYGKHSQANAIVGSSKFYPRYFSLANDDLYVMRDDLFMWLRYLVAEFYEAKSISLLKVDLTEIVYDWFLDNVVTKESIFGIHRVASLNYFMPEAIDPSAAMTAMSSLKYHIVEKLSSHRQADLNLISLILDSALGSKSNCARFVAAMANEITDVASIITKDKNKISVNFSRYNELGDNIKSSLNFTSAIIHIAISTHSKHIKNKDDAKTIGNISGIMIKAMTEYTVSLIRSFPFIFKDKTYQKDFSLLLNTLSSKLNKIDDDRASLCAPVDIIDKDEKLSYEVIKSEVKKNSARSVRSEVSSKSLKMASSVLSKNAYGESVFNTFFALDEHGYPVTDLLNQSRRSSDAQIPVNLSMVSSMYYVNRYVSPPQSDTLAPLGHYHNIVDNNAVMDMLKFVDLSRTSSACNAGVAAIVGSTGSGKTTHIMRNMDKALVIRFGEPSERIDYFSAEKYSYVYNASDIAEVLMLSMITSSLGVSVYVDSIRSLMSDLSGGLGKEGIPTKLYTLLTTINNVFANIGSMVYIAVNPMATDELISKDLFPKISSAVASAFFIADSQIKRSSVRRLTGRSIEDAANDRLRDKNLSQGVSNISGSFESSDLDDIYSINN